jgi:hypothetical protein
MCYLLELVMHSCRYVHLLIHLSSTVPDPASKSCVRTETCHFYIDIIDFDADLIDRYHRTGIDGKCSYWTDPLACL